MRFLTLCWKHDVCRKEALPSVDRLHLCFVRVFSGSLFVRFGGAKDPAWGLTDASQMCSADPHNQAEQASIFKGHCRHWFDLKLASNHDRLIHILS